MTCPAVANRPLHIATSRHVERKAFTAHRAVHAQAAEQDAAEAQMQGARSQSVFNSSLGFLGKDYAPLENSLSAHGPSPDTGNDTCAHTP